MYQWLVEVVLRASLVIIWRLLVVIIKACIGVVCIVIGVWFSRLWTQASFMPNRAFLVLTGYLWAGWYAFLFVWSVLVAFFMAGSQVSTGALATAFRFWNSSKRQPRFVKHYNRCWVRTESILGRIGDVVKLLPFDWAQY